MKKRTINISFIVSLIIPFTVISISSCKPNNCSEIRIVKLDRDTTLIPYTGYETFKFIVEDSLGNFLDSLTYEGQGKEKYIFGSEIEYDGCSDGISYDSENVEYTYVNKKDSKEKLKIRQQKERSVTNFLITITTNNNITIYKAFTLYFSGSAFGPHHDTLTVKGTKYFNVVQFLTGGFSDRSAYYGKYDALLYLEETKNRIWYKVN